MLNPINIRRTKVSSQKLAALEKANTMQDACRGALLELVCYAREQRTAAKQYRGFPVYAQTPSVLY